VKSPLWLPAGKRSPGERGESRPTDGGPADRGAFRLATAWVWWALASEIAVSALLCSVSIGSKSLWQDEGSSVSFARDSFTQLLRVEWHSEENQTLYYGLLHWWIRLGSTEADLRSLSAIAAVAAVAAADPRLVFVGLGFPKQERLIENLRQALPGSWFLGCGAGIPMAAGVVPRASAFTQKLGLEWLHRLALEPRRLAGRYLRDDMPFALELLVRSALRRVIRRWP